MRSGRRFTLFHRVGAALACAGLTTFSLLVAGGSPAFADEALALQVQPVPAELNFPAFYKKCVVVHGFPIVGSEKVHDAALLEAAYLIDRMIGQRKDVLTALAANKVRFSVMAYDELTTDVPEHSDLEPKRYWDRRARGLGPTDIRPSVSCGEENLLEFPGDPYGAENILVHEFAHAIHLMGLNSVDKGFDARLKSVYDAAMSEKLWETKYGASNKEEYWAEGVQSYFDTNRVNDHDHNDVDTREELAKYDPRLHDLIDETFKSPAWRYQRPSRRDDAERKHLAGFDAAKSPKFAWPEALDRWFKEHGKDAAPK